MIRIVRPGGIIDNREAVIQDPSGAVGEARGWASSITLPTVGSSCPRERSIRMGVLVDYRLPGAAWANFEQPGSGTTRLKEILAVGRTRHGSVLGADAKPRESRDTASSRRLSFLQKQNRTSVRGGPAS